MRHCSLLGLTLGLRCAQAHICFPPVGGVDRVVEKTKPDCLASLNSSKLNGAPLRSLVSQVSAVVAVQI